MYLSVPPQGHAQQQVELRLECRGLLAVEHRRSRNATHLAVTPWSGRCLWRELLRVALIFGLRGGLQIESRVLQSYGAGFGVENGPSRWIPKPGAGSPTNRHLEVPRPPPPRRVVPPSRDGHSDRTRTTAPERSRPHPCHPRRLPPRLRRRNHTHNRPRPQTAGRGLIEPPRILRRL